MKPEAAAVIGALTGLVYFQAEESQVPSDANCSYLASPVTDAVALAGGAFCAERGIKLGDPWISAFGACVVAIHVMQYVHHKHGRGYP